MLEIRCYQNADYHRVWNLHVVGLQQVGAYGGDGPWDNDLRSIEDVYLKNRGTFLVGVCEGRIVAIGQEMFEAMLREELQQAVRTALISVLEAEEESCLLLFYAVIRSLKFKKLTMPAASTKQLGSANLLTP